MQNFSRQRYSCWAALGDIGGFHDGLILIVSIFMGSISSSSFTNALVNGAYHFPFNRGPPKDKEMASEK